MAQIVYSATALDDLERLTDFLLEVNPSAAQETVTLISEAVAVLARHPMIGRPVESGFRELVISRGATGYVALYTLEEGDCVAVHAIRHQREAGFGAGF